MEQNICRANRCQNLIGYLKLDPTKLTDVRSPPGTVRRSMRSDKFRTFSWLNRSLTFQALHRMDLEVELWRNPLTVVTTPTQASQIIEI